MILPAVMSTIKQEWNMWSIYLDAFFPAAGNRRNCPETRITKCAQKLTNDYDFWQLDGWLLVAATLGCSFKCSQTYFYFILDIDIGHELKKNKIVVQPSGVDHRSSKAGIKSFHHSTYSTVIISPFHPTKKVLNIFFRIFFTSYVFFFQCTSKRTQT